MVVKLSIYLSNALYPRTLICYETISCDINEDFASNLLDHMFIFPPIILATWLGYIAKMMIVNTGSWRDLIKEIKNPGSDIGHSDGIADPIRSENVEYPIISDRIQINFLTIQNFGYPRFRIGSDIR